MTKDKYTMEVSEEYVKITGTLNIREAFDFLNFFEREGYGILESDEYGTTLRMKKGNAEEERKKMINEESLNYIKELEDDKKQLVSDLNISLRRVDDLEYLIKKIRGEGNEINQKLKEAKRMSETMPNFEEITKINTPLHEDDELHKKLREAASQMRGNEQKILDDFCKAYYAAESKMTGNSLMSIIKDVRLNVQQFFKDGQMGTRYWFELKEDEDGVAETN